MQLVMRKPGGGYRFVRRVLPSSADKTNRETITIVRSREKIGRNDPCPCGSGRKFKRCHERLEKGGF